MLNTKKSQKNPKRWREKDWAPRIGKFSGGWQKACVLALASPLTLDKPCNPSVLRHLIYKMGTIPYWRIVGIQKFMHVKSYIYHGYILGGHFIIIRKKFSLI